MAKLSSSPLAVSTIWSTVTVLMISPASIVRSQSTWQHPVIFSFINIPTGIRTYSSFNGWAQTRTQPFNGGFWPRPSWAHYAYGWAWSSAHQSEPSRAHKTNQLLKIETRGELWYHPSYQNSWDLREERLVLKENQPQQIHPTEDN